MTPAVRINPMSVPLPDNSGVQTYDPYHPVPEYRKPLTRKFDEVFSIYVLNVVPREQGLQILDEIHSLLKPTGTAIIAVRRDL
jgi:hypothetical protein